MEELKQMLIYLLDHIDNHKESYKLPEWTNEAIVDAHLNTHKNKINKLLTSNDTNADVVDTMHQEVFNEFHELRKTKGNTLSISMDGLEMNEIIRRGKITTKKEHCL